MAAYSFVQPKNFPDLAFQDCVYDPQVNLPGGFCLISPIFKDYFPFPGHAFQLKVVGPIS